MNKLQLPSKRLMWSPLVSVLALCFCTMLSPAREEFVRGGFVMNVNKIIAER